GGRNYAASQYNRAVKSRRQPGSAFKPFVFLAALESGQTPDSIAYDLPLSIEGWTPRNTTGRYQGAMPLRRALAESVNTVAARLQFDVGARRVTNVARRLGIRSELREDPSLALGTSELTLLELTGSYGVFANGGSSIVPHVIRRVRMSSGRVLFAQGATRTEQVVAPVHVGAMNDMLNAALTGGTGRRAALVRHPAAGKTGTTSDFRDAVFIGYTAHFVAGVWSGNDNGKPMNNVMGGGLPAEIWREVMVAAHGGKAPLALPGTAGSVPSGPSADAAPQPAAGDLEPKLLPWQRPVASPAPVARRLVPTPSVAAGRGNLVAPRPDALPAAAPAPRPPSTPQNRADATVVPTGKSIGLPKAVPSLHPAERIDEDFIARAMGGVAEPPHPPSIAGLPAGFDVEAIRQRLKVSPEGARPPQGMMTLGSPSRP
ncbi:MAG: penicillin-binding transpeptidase domain-containing protein, partial [Hyphomicrobium sp.]